MPARPSLRRASTVRFWFAPVVGASLLTITLALVPSAAAARSVTPAIAVVRGDHMVRSTQDPDIELHVREKYREGSDPRSIGRPVLFVHGLDMPGGVFDLPVPGYSLMDAAARHDHVAYAVDLRGYGRSTHPPAERVTSRPDRPLAGQQDVLADLDDVVRFALGRTGATQIDLVGLGHGAHRIGYYAMAFPETVGKLVMLSAAWNSPDPAAQADLTDPGAPDRLTADRRTAYATMPADPTPAWNARILDDSPDVYREPGVARSLAEYLAGSDRSWRIEGNPGYRVPNGPWVDRLAMARGRFVYDPAQVSTPTLVLSGTWSASPDGAWRLFYRLSTTYKRFVLVAYGTDLMHLERVAPQVQGEIMLWLNE